MLMINVIKKTNSIFWVGYLKVYKQNKGSSIVAVLTMSWVTALKFN